MNLSSRSVFLFMPLLLAIVVTTSGCFFDYSTARTGKISYETYENCMLKIEKLALKNDPSIADTKYQLFYEHETFYLKAAGHGSKTRNHLSQRVRLFFKIAPSYSMVSVKTLPKGIRAIRAVAESDYNDFDIKRSFSWKRYQCLLTTTSYGCQDTADTRIDIKESWFKKSIAIHNLGNTTVFICDINHDGLKDLLMINQYNCQGIDEIYFIAYPKAMNGKRME